VVKRPETILTFVATLASRDGETVDEIDTGVGERILKIVVPAAVSRRLPLSLRECMLAAFRLP
jgi:hypothetical protein